MSLLRDYVLLLQQINIAISEAQFKESTLNLFCINLFRVPSSDFKYLAKCVLLLLEYDLICNIFLLIDFCHSS